ncbi:hypothetical protein [Novosphingobium sp.]|uniref:hypothetical protein n=1 Tax=Novosphingobium sp. TaxID=1874826 RepID=UPI00286ACD55|nr:hypothetical protein [Novosphingobium sp.]
MSGDGNPVDTKIASLGDSYCAIMNTVADRLDAIGDAIAHIDAHPNHAENWRNAEFCYLQVRKCVEYVALAVLLAHKVNHYECEKLENAYKADVIFNDLGKLNPHGFPKAIQIGLNDDQTGQHHVDQCPTLSKRRLKRIYDDCAVHLHSGTLTGIVNQTVPPYDLPRVVAWRDEIASMLSQHQVMLPHVGSVMIVWLREPSTGSARVIFGQAEGPFQIEGDPTVYNDIESK